MIKVILKKIGFILLTLSAVAGFFLAAGYVAVYFGWTDLAGQVDKNNDKYGVMDDGLPVATSTNGSLSDPAEIGKRIELLAAIKAKQEKLLCQINEIKHRFPVNGGKIIEAYEETGSEMVVGKMIKALEIRAANATFSAQMDSCGHEDFTGSMDDILSIGEISSTTPDVFPWVNRDEWRVIKQSIIKDETVIKRASIEAGVDSRLVVSVLIVEQLRLYFTQREMFERLFKPLFILANANKMAWGVMSIKEKTAIGIEERLKDQGTPFYLGEKYEHLLDFSTDDHGRERYDRLTNEKDHYYSYLYGALYLREIMSQWEKAGWPIDDRPEILATIFNIGFKNSQPKADPAVGGSQIMIGNEEYSFGALAYEFFFSGEMDDKFPIAGE